MASPKVPSGVAPYRPKSQAEITRNMSAIRSSGNRTESAVRKAVHRLGLRYRKYSGKLPGRPDIVFAKAKVAVFIDGDYWHARVLQERGLEALERSLRRAETRGYWLAKFQRRVERDREVTQKLTDAGWLVLRFWESDARRSVSGTAEEIAGKVRERLEASEGAG